MNRGPGQPGEKSAETQRPLCGVAPVRRLPLEFPMPSAGRVSRALWWEFTATSLVRSGSGRDGPRRRAAYWPRSTPQLTEGFDGADPREACTLLDRFG
jgi:hypothetical protein